MLTQNLKNKCNILVFQTISWEKYVENDIDKSNTLINNKYKDLKDNSDANIHVLVKHQDAQRWQSLFRLWCVWCL